MLNPTVSIDGAPELSPPLTGDLLLHGTVDGGDREAHREARHEHGADAHRCEQYAWEGPDRHAVDVE